MAVKDPAVAKSTRLMRAYLILLSALLASASFTSFEAPPAGIMSNGVCRPPSEASDDRLAFFTDVVTRTDEENTALRQAVMLLRVTTTPAVTLVADDSICAAVAAAVEAFLGDGLTRSSLWVLRAGPERYVAFDGSQDHGWSVHWVFDSSLNYLSTVQGYVK
jgi:hypothetical protein